MVALLAYLEKIHPLSEGLKEHLKRIVRAQVIRKKEYVLKAGRTCEQIHFIESGLLRCYYIKNQTEICSWFMKEGDLAISVKSFFEQEPSYESIQALEKTELLNISYRDLQAIYQDYPEFNFVGRVLTEKYYVLSEQRLYALRMERAPGRYGYLLQNAPELIRRVPAVYIASYLGITMETLSRIKARQ
jgi:CRP/FNR family transcriptional regulator, anaerobic regulatory protein